MTRNSRGMLAAGAVGLALAAYSGHAVSSGMAGATSTGANVTLGQQLAAARGWTGPQWDCLNWLWTRESGWNAGAVNPHSGATGIPQLLPSAHVIPPDWDSPQVQITWGLDYIAGRYGSPCAAWDHEEQNGWY